MKTLISVLSGCLLAFSGKGVEIDLGTASVEVSPAVSAKTRTELGKAAKELTDHLTLVCGEAPKGGGVRFVLGAPPAGEKPADEFFSHVAVRDGALWFWGDDSGSGPDVASGVWRCGKTASGCPTTAIGFDIAFAGNRVTHARSNSTIASRTAA